MRFRKVKKKIYVGLNLNFILLKKRIIKYAILAFGIGLLFQNCQEESTICPEDPVPYLRCVFTNSSGIITDSFVVVLTTIDSVIYDDDAPTSRIKIPLQLSADSTLFHVIFHEDSIDYFLIKHEPTVTFESPECGFLTSFVIDSNSQYSRHKVDSIYLLNTLIDRESNDNLQIFY